MPTTESTRGRAVLGAVAVLAAVAAVAVPVSAHAGAPPGCGDRPAVRRVLDHMTGVHGLTGAAVRVDDPRCGPWTAASGYADRRTGRPMNAAMRVRAASITKSFTATALLALAAEHRISLDAPIARYLPGVVDRNGYDGRTITVRSLLRHTSGLPDHMDTFETTEEFRFRHFEPEALVERALSLPRPDSEWHYSTTNYVLAGLIIERVTGHRAEDEIERRIIDPLRLRDTYWPGDQLRIRGPHPRGYVRQGENGTVRWTDYTAMNTTVAWTGGALLSSPQDMSAFYGALLGGRLLPPRQLAEMKRTVALDPDRVWNGARYGLGVIGTPLRCGGTWWGHAGDIDGFTSIAGVAPSGRRAAIAFNENPSTKEAFDEELNLVQTALCDPR
ncbi:class A beta-lactamase-related serine hydrolase [Actinomadura sp. KC216]|uniref:serine hydrolase domain-containing protein n=1 Tax=Actinomadura sp. KC216 TaxID=2530370 RepID=UPI001046A6CB|nr:serine hydrolase domain-containing protein [Actinomadura sp. KC216]TDB84474.1 class A beta-lactamase-related serine hydrolase [Actinomadura sp. KC216]